MTVRILAAGLVVCAGFAAAPLAAQETPVPNFSAAGDHDSSQRIWEALRKPLPEAGLELTDTALEEVVAMLRDEYGIQILFDKPALEDLGIDATQPVNVNLRNISLQAALKLILKELELTYVANNEVLLITTQEEADTMLTVCIYPVRDLLDPNYLPTESDKKRGTPAELIPIKNALITTVAGDTWAENGGGEAEIRALRPGLLVISQTQAVHEDISNTLAAIRRGKQFAQENQIAPEQTAEAGMGRGGGGEMMGYGGGYGAGRGGYRWEHGRGGGYGGVGEYGGAAQASEADPFGASPEEAQKAAEERRRRQYEQERVQSEHSKNAPEEDPFGE